MATTGRHVAVGGLSLRFLSLLDSFCSWRRLRGIRVGLHSQANFVQCSAVDVGD